MFWVWFRKDAFLGFSFYHLGCQLNTEDGTDLQHCNVFIIFVQVVFALKTFCVVIFFVVYVIQTEPRHLMGIEHPDFKYNKDG